MLNFTPTISRQPVNKALPYAVFQQEGLVMPPPRFLSMKQPALKPLSGDTKPATLLSNNVGNISCTASEGRPSMFLMDVEFIHKMEAIKASAKESGDKGCEALAIASLTLYKLTKNRTAFANAIKKWVGMIDRDAIIKNIPYIKKTNEDLISHIHSISQWRPLKQGPEAVRKFAQKRVDLAERMKAIIPKEASAWAISQITNGDLNSYLPEILKTRSLHYAAAVISDGNILFLPALAEKIAQMDDMELWTEEHLINALIEFKEIRSLLTDELYRVIFSIYATSATSLWTFIDQHEPIEGSTSGKFDLPGLANLNNCICDDCQHDRQVFGGFDLNWMISMVGSTICESKAWGDFAPFIKTILDMSSEARLKLLGEISSANAVVWRVGQDLIEEHRLKEVALKNARKDKKQATKEMEHAKAQIANLNRQIGEMRKARAKPGSKPAPADTSLFEEELKLSRKTNDQVRNELGKKEAELKQVYELLDSVLSSQHEKDGGLVPVKLSSSELIEKRGIVIGGHYTLVAKLRKELTNCQFYSPDAKSLDDEAVRNCEYILFFTGYVNHCLTGHALRLSRLYNIPCGYTHRTNVSLVLKDIETIFAGSVLPPVAAIC